MFSFYVARGCRLERILLRHKSFDSRRWLIQERSLKRTQPYVKKSLILPIQLVLSPPKKKQKTPKNMFLLFLHDVLSITNTALPPAHWTRPEGPPYLIAYLVSFRKKKKHKLFGVFVIFSGKTIQRKANKTVKNH